LVVRRFYTHRNFFRATLTNTAVVARYSRECGYREKAM
jgi:hypothetical protein